MSNADTPSEDRIFRWQALFQRTADPLFILDRRQRLVFVNRAWEALTSLPAAEIRGLLCRRPRPASATDRSEDILAHALTPPAEALQAPARIRRLLPGQGGKRRWWDVDFFPLRLDVDGGAFLLGRIIPVNEGQAVTLSLPEKLVNLRETHARRHGSSLLTSRSPAVERLAQQVRLAARIDEPALLLGEPGAGKKTVARAIHYQGPRREKAFVVVDCVHLPGAVLVETVFGSCTQTAAGTLYLSEPASLPRDLQLRLLDWLLGPGRDAKSPRLLAGCRQDPATDVGAGRLLEELRCAISPLVLVVPPLRERRGDLVALTNWLLVRANEHGEPRITGLTPAAWDLLQQHSWPGNLRELHNVLSAARHQAKNGIVDAGDLPAYMRLAQRLGPAPVSPAAPKITLDQVLAQVERRLIEQALSKARGNKTRAAEQLGIWRQRLTRRMEALGIADTEETGE